MGAKHSEAMRRRWADPTYRAAKLAAMRTPEFEQRKVDGIRQYEKNRVGPHHALGKEHPNTAKATRHPSVRDLEWAAGFLEGEGCFYQSNAGRKGTAYVTAYQNEREPVAKMLTLFGGALHQRQPRRRCPNGVWVWRASGPRARGIAMTMYSLMSGRRQGQILTALGHAK